MQHGLGPFVRLDVAHDGAVDLDRIDRELSQIVEGGGARAEVVDADLDAGFAQGGQAPVGGLDVGEGRSLGDFDHQAPAFLGRAGGHAQKLFDIGVVAQRGAGDVDRHLQQAGARLAHPLQHLFRHGQIEGFDEVQFLGHADGVGGAAVGVEAGQGLEVMNGARVEVDDGLIVDLEFTRLDQAAEGLGVAEGAFQRVREGDLRIDQAVALQAALDGEPHGAQDAQRIRSRRHGRTEGFGAERQAFGTAGLDDFGGDVAAVVGGTQQGEPHAGHLGRARSLDGGGLQGRLDAAVQTVGDFVADVLHSPDIDEGQGQIRVGVQHAPGVRQEILRFQQGADGQVGQGESGTFIRDGAGHGRRHLRQDEGSERGASHAVGTGRDENGGGRDARPRLHVAQRRQGRGAFVQQINQRPASPGRAGVLARDGARADREGDDALRVHLDQRVGGCESQAKKTNGQRHEDVLTRLRLKIRQCRSGGSIEGHGAAVALGRAAVGGVCGGRGAGGRDLFGDGADQALGNLAGGVDGAPVTGQNGVESAGGFDQGLAVFERRAAQQGRVRLHVGGIATIEIGHLLGLGQARRHVLGAAVGEGEGLGFQALGQAQRQGGQLAHARLGQFGIAHCRPSCIFSISAMTVLLRPMPPALTVFLAISSSMKLRQVASP